VGDGGPGGRCGGTIACWDSNERKVARGMAARNGENGGEYAVAFAVNGAVATVTIGGARAAGACSEHSCCALARAAHAYAPLISSIGVHILSGETPAR